MARFWKIFSHILLAVTVLLALSAFSAGTAGAYWGGGSADDDPCPPKCPKKPAALKNVLLPDLQTLPPYHLSLLLDKTNGTRALRFSNSVVNTGKGPIEVRGVRNNETNIVTVTQHVYGEDDSVEVKRGVGTIRFHEPHNHWHWQGFSNYEIWTVAFNAGLAELAAGNDKVSYCLVDSERPPREWLEEHTSGTPVSEPRAYRECLWRLQGISPGWMDTYLSHLEGQTIDITGLPDGVYALRSVVNPDGILYEEDLTNNEAITYFTLKGNEVRQIEDASEVRVMKFEEKYGPLALPPEPERINEDQPVPW